MRLIHLTDPHLSNLDGHRFATLSPKRRSGYLSWTRKRHLIHRRDTLELLTRAVRAEQPDLLLLSGDLVQIGLESEIAQVSEWLGNLEAETPVFFVPGNHDVYATDSWPAMRRHWAAFLPAPEQGSADDAFAGYPLIRDLGSVRIIGVSSACVTPIFSARGSLGHEQMDRLAGVLRSARNEGRMPLLVIHHPPLPGMAPWRKALKEVTGLENLLTAEPPAVVCCGHLHQNIEQALGETRVFSTASASDRRHASYRILDIEPTANATPAGWTIRMQLKSLGGEPATSFRVTDEQSWVFSL